VKLVSSTPASSEQDGLIELKIDKNATLGNTSSASLKVVFTTLDSEEFTFEKYITFVKYMTGSDGTDAVTFEIYSTQGFIFKEGLNSIELKINPSPKRQIS
jgi:predicted metalloprotease with PDZ domain